MSITTKARGELTKNTLGLELDLGAIPFTLAQIGAWIQLGMPDFVLGVADKSVQVALIALFAYLFVSERHGETRDLEAQPAIGEAEVEVGRPMR